MTGWGQDGPLADEVGHDLNYLAVTGLLAMLGPRRGKPTIPLNLLGDFAGGGLYLALGILSGILEARRSGKGQAIDVAMIDGIASLTTHQFGMVGSGQWKLEREVEFHRWWVAMVQCLPDQGWQIRLDRTDRGEILCRAGAAPRARFCDPARAVRPRLLAGDAREICSNLCREDARRVVRGDGGPRNLLRARAGFRRGRRSPAYAGAAQPCHG